MTGYLFQTPYEIAQDACDNAYNAVLAHERAKHFPSPAAQMYERARRTKTYIRARNLALSVRAYAVPSGLIVEECYTLTAQANEYLQELNQDAER